MARHTSGWAALAAALMLVLAGCAGGVSSGPSGSDAGAAAGDDGGTVDFYISDQQNAIDQFEHLNVTVSEVELVRAGEDDEEAEADDGTETETEANETDTDDAGDDDAERVTHDVNNVTVDLTELQGANSTKIGNLSVPNGTYTQVVVHVESVNGTLTNGESAAVKLPSEKLRLNEGFTVGNGESVDFVFDITVTERGNNGYILKPVAGESGTGDEVEIEEVDDLSEDADDESEDEADDDESETDDESEAEEDDSENAADEGEENADGAGQSSMDFYLSDEQHAMGDFEHLNVTVTEVGLQRGGESGEWVETDVDDRTVDLTTLPGANATKLGTFGVDNGTYTKVFVHVDEINATLENGESTTVKLPSDKLQLNTEFTVGNGEDVDFVYDMSVFEAGNSGKYILKPVVSESGTSDEVPIEDVDENESDESDDDAEDDEETELVAAFDGTVTAGENATVEVTRNGSAVENASVTVEQALADDETTETYETGANGTVTFLVDANATELTVEVVDGDDEAELEREFEATDDTDGDADDTDDGSEDAALRPAI